MTQVTTAEVEAPAAAPRRTVRHFDHRARSRLTFWVLGGITLLFLLYQWLPILTLGLLSFSGPTGGTTFPMNGVSLHWYRELWDASIMNDFKPPLARSFLLALACSATTIVLAVMAAQAVRGRFRGNGLFFYLLLLGIMAPGILVGFGFALLMRLMGLELSWSTTTFITHVTWTLPFGFLTMLAVFNRFDSRLEEAALTLGASRLTAFRRVTLPIVLPGVIGAGLFGFSLSYDEYPRSLFTTGADLTLPLAVMAQLDRQLTPELYAIGTTTTAFSFIAIGIFTFAFWALRRRVQSRKP
jgi:putative spermidine/putrescine transport system permease protein